MLNKIATHDSRTTTGGYVIATLSRLNNHGRKVAIRGDVATCGNCAGTWPIAASGHLMCDKGRPVVIDRDPITCPCGENRVIAAMDTMRYETRRTNPQAPHPNKASNDASADQVLSSDDAKRSQAPSSSETNANNPAIRRIYIYDSHDASPLRHRSYILEVNGARSYGMTNDEGVATIHTNGEQVFRLHVVFASMREELAGYESR